MAGPYKWNTSKRRNRNLYKSCVLSSRMPFYDVCNNCSRFLMWVSFESVSIYNEHWKLKHEIKNPVLSCIHLLPQEGNAYLRILKSKQENSYYAITLFTSKSLWYLFRWTTSSAKTFSFPQRALCSLCMGSVLQLLHFWPPQYIKAVFPPLELCILSFTSQYCPMLSQECSLDTVSELSLQNWVEKGQLSILT